MLSQENSKQIVFCCALGEYRGPGLSECVPGSSFVEFGYTGIANWLRQIETAEEKVSELKLFYSQALMIFIVDDPDKSSVFFQESLSYIEEFFVKAGIVCETNTFQEALEKFSLEKTPATLS